MHRCGEDYYVDVAEDRNEPNPKLVEVKDAIHQLKTYKAAGKGGIAAKLIQMDREKSKRPLKNNEY